MLIAVHANYPLRLYSSTWLPLLLLLLLLLLI